MQAHVHLPFAWDMEESPSSSGESNWYWVSNPGGESNQWKVGQSNPYFQGLFPSAERCRKYPHSIPRAGHSGAHCVVTGTMMDSWVMHSETQTWEWTLVFLSKQGIVDFHVLFFKAFGPEVPCLGILLQLILRNSQVDPREGELLRPFRQRNIIPK